MFRARRLVKRIFEPNLYLADVNGALGDGDKRKRTIRCESACCSADDRFLETRKSGTVTDTDIHGDACVKMCARRECVA